MTINPCAAQSTASLTPATARRRSAVGVVSRVRVPLNWLKHGSLTLAAIAVCVGSATAQTPPPPPKPLTSPTPSPTAQPTASPSPTASPTAQPAASPSPAPTAAPAASEATPAQSLSTPEPEASPAGDSAIADPQLQEQIQAEVDRAFTRAMSPLNTLLIALTLFPIAATVFGIWLLRRSIGDRIVHEVKEQIGQELKAEIEAELIGGGDRPSESALAPMLPNPAEDKNAQLNELISMALATQNLLAEARNTLEESMKMQNKVGEPFREVFGLYLKQGFELFHEGKYQQSLEMYERATQVDPDCYDAWLGRGVALTELQQYDEAISSYNKAIRVHAEQSDPWYGKARCYALKNDVDMVVDNLKRAIALNPQIRDLIQTNPDFDCVRETEAFDNLVRDI